MKVILLSLFLVVSCVSQVTEELGQGKTYKGIDIDNQTRTCTDSGITCAAYSPEIAKFDAACEESGSFTIACGCLDHICVGDLIKTGKDINGETKSCAPAEELICTTQFTDEDQFA